MKISIVIYVAGQIVASDSPANMSMVDCELRVSFLRLQQSLILLKAETDPSPATRSDADAVRGMTFVCEER